ncbi:DUF5325 family protein [Bacillus salitolerans]|uniref:DUF5325 family protein n=1 Tax=Bacillus salitolerans TaxID=1437434 RepID=A0ABW4LKM1_9BACI
MQRQNVIFLILAITTAIFMMLIGVAIGEGSILGIIGSIIGVILIMGIGFAYKGKLRKKE